MFKKILLTLGLCALAGWAQATPILSRSDSLVIPFSLLDSVGIPTNADTANDSGFLRISSAGGDSVYAIGFHLGDSRISHFKSPTAKIADLYTFGDLVSVLDGSSTNEGVYTYHLALFDNSAPSHLNRTWYRGDFQVINDELATILDSVGLAAVDVAGLAGAAPPTNWNSMAILGTGEVGIDLDNTQGTIDVAEIAAAVYEEVWRNIDTTNVDTSLIGEWLTKAMWLAGTRTLTALGFTLDSTDFADSTFTGLLHGSSYWSEFATVNDLQDANGKRVLSTGTPTTTTINATALTEADDYWNDQIIFFLNGNADGQAARITDFTASTDLLTFTPALSVAPASGDSFYIFSLAEAAGAGSLDSGIVSRIMHRVGWGTPKGSGADSSTLAERDVTVATNNDKTGYSLTATEWEEVWRNIDTTNIDTSLIGEWLTKAGWNASTRTLTALGFTLAAGDFGAGSLDGKGDWNVGKTGYSLTATEWEEVWRNIDTTNIDTSLIGEWLTKAGWNASTRTLTALGFALAAGDFGAGSLNGKGDWNVGKTGYTLSAAGIKEFHDRLGTHAEATGTPTTTTIASTSLTQADDYWNDQIIYFIDGAAAGQAARITDFVAATDLLTFTPAVIGTPVATDSFYIFGFIEAPGSGATLNAGEYTKIKDTVWLSLFSTLAGSFIDSLVLANEMATKQELASETADSTLLSAIAARNTTAASWGISLSNAVRTLNPIFGTIDGATPTATGFSATELTQADDYWNNQMVMMLSGNAAGQAARISDFTAATDSITFDPVLSTAPAQNDTFIILGLVYEQPSAGGGLDTLATLFVDRLVGRVADTVWKSLFTARDDVGGSFADSLLSILTQVDTTIFATLDQQADYFGKRVLSTGTPTTTTIASTALTEADDYWNDQMIFFLNGNADGQSARITDFVASTDLLTFTPALSVAPASGDSFYIFSFAEAAAGASTFDPTTDSVMVDVSVALQALIDSIGAHAWQGIDTAGVDSSALGVWLVNNLVGAGSDTAAILTALRNNGDLFDVSNEANLVRNGGFEDDSVTTTTAPAGWTHGIGDEAGSGIRVAEAGGGRHQYAIASSLNETSIMYQRVGLLGPGLYWLGGTVHATSTVDAYILIDNAIPTTTSAHIDSVTMSTSALTHEIGDVVELTAATDVYVGLRIDEVVGGDTLRVDNIKLIPLTLDTTAYQGAAAGLTAADVADSVWSHVDSAWASGTMGDQLTDQSDTNKIILAYFDTLIYQGPEGLGIYIDSASGNTNTALGTDGTSKNPVSTLTAARTLSDALGVKRYYFMAKSTFNSAANDLAADHQDFHFVGLGYFPEIAFGGQRVDGAKFEDMKVSGALHASGGAATYRNCIFGYVTANFNGHAENSWLTDTIVLKAGQGIDFTNCQSAVPGNSSPTIDLSAGAQQISIRDYSGGIRLMNGSSNDTVSYEADGQLIVSANNTSLTVSARGNMTITDSGTTTSLTRDAVFSRQDAGKWIWSNRDTTDVDSSDIGVWLTNSGGGGSDTAAIAAMLTSNLFSGDTASRNWVDSLKSYIDDTLAAAHQSGDWTGGASLTGGAWTVTLGMADTSGTVDLVEGVEISFWNEAGAFLGTATTGGSGYVTLNMDSGKYAIAVNSLDQDHFWEGGRDTIQWLTDNDTIPRILDKTPADSLTVLDSTLLGYDLVDIVVGSASPTTSVVWGVVYDAQGNPVSGALVVGELRGRNLLDTTNVNIVYASIADTLTNDTGYFQLEVVRTSIFKQGGRWNFSVSKNGIDFMKVSAYTVPDSASHRIRWDSR